MKFNKILWKLIPKRRFVNYNFLFYRKRSQLLHKFFITNLSDGRKLPETSIFEFISISSNKYNGLKRIFIFNKNSGAVVLFLDIIFLAPLGDHGYVYNFKFERIEDDENYIKELINEIKSYELQT